MGGTLARLTDAGQRILLIDLTDGEPTEFAEPGVRAQQAAEAARILGVERCTLGLRDRLLQDTPEARVSPLSTVIDRTGRHVYQPGWLYVPFGGPAPKRWERAERGLLSRKVDLVVGQAERIDRDGHTIQMADGTSYPYDDLVITTGASLAPETIPGYADGAYHFYSPEAAVRLREALEAFRGGKILIGVADIPYTCPPAPLEFTFLLDEYLRKRGLRERTEITYLSPISRVSTIESVATFVTPLLEERGIQHEEFFNTESIDPRAKTIMSMEGTELSYDVLVLVPPHRGVPMVVDSGLGDEQGWIPTDKQTLQTKADPRIYAIGDGTDVPFQEWLGGSLRGQDGRRSAGGRHRRQPQRKPVRRAG